MAKGSPKKSVAESKIRLELGKALLLMANVAAGSLVFQETITQQPFDPWVMLFGVLLVSWLYSLAYLVMRGGGRL